MPLATECYKTVRVELQTWRDINNPWHLWACPIIKLNLLEQTKNAEHRLWSVCKTKKCEYTVCPGPRLVNQEHSENSRWVSLVTGHVPSRHWVEIYLGCCPRSTWTHKLLPEGSLGGDVIIFWLQQLGATLPTCTDKPGFCRRILKESYKWCSQASNTKYNIACKLPFKLMNQVNELHRIIASNVS